jgi:hypothetical protein
MATLSDALKDKKGFPDAQEVAIGDGLKITLGELRAYQEATGQDVAKQLSAEREKMAEEQLKLTKAQEEVVNLWTSLQEAKNKQPKSAPAEGTDWTTDPFFAPIAKYLKDNVESTQAKQQEQISQFQKALGLGVKYITDTFSEMRYQSLPEEFRKEVGYDVAVKTAAEKRYLDSGGVPDIRKVYQEWQSPRQQKAEIEKVRKEAFEQARNEVMANQLSRPSGLPTGSAPATADPNAPHTIRESFNRLKSDPEFLKQIYDLTGQA